jgi:hypothetical protein
VTAECVACSMSCAATRSNGSIDCSARLRITAPSLAAISVAANIDACFRDTPAFTNRSVI